MWSERREGAGRRMKEFHLRGKNVMMHGISVVRSHGARVYILGPSVVGRLSYTKHSHGYEVENKMQQPGQRRPARPPVTSGGIMQVRKLGAHTHTHTLIGFSLTAGRSMSACTASTAASSGLPRAGAPLPRCSLPAPTEAKELLRTGLCLAGRGWVAAPPAPRWLLVPRGGYSRPAPPGPPPPACECESPAGPLPPACRCRPVPMSALVPPLPTLIGTEYFHGPPPPPGGGNSAFAAAAIPKSSQPSRWLLPSGGEAGLAQAVRPLPCPTDVEMACEAKTLGNLLPPPPRKEVAEAEAAVGATAAPTTSWLVTAAPWKPTRSGRLAIGKMEATASRDDEEAKCGAVGR